MDRTRFNFIRNRRGTPIGCLAYKVNREEGTFTYNVSTHNPKDEFDRKTARFVAEGRMNKHPRKIEFSTAAQPTLETLLRDAFAEMLYDENVPNRLKKGLLIWLDYKGAKISENEIAIPISLPVYHKPNNTIETF